jgi:hypothetical protein
MIRFYDNDMKHIIAVRKMCPYIDTRYVEETNIRYRDFSYAKSFKGTNTYAQVILNNSPESKVVDGLQKSEINNIIEWSKKEIEESKTHPEIVKRKILLDFDCTLSRVEGVMIPAKGWTLEDYDTTYEDTLNYVLGDRTELLKHMFVELEKNGVDIYILTNNQGCISNKEELLKILKIMHPNLDDDHLLCSGAAYYINKGHFLSEHPVFKGVC